ncbi:MAG: hypothetical protein ABI577_05420 [bacterium]
MAFRFQRRCKARVLSTGEDCRQSPLIDRDFCFWHDPESVDAAKEARRTGGLRRRREGTLAGHFDFEGIESDGGLARLLNIAVFDCLSLDLSVNRVRALVAIVQTAEKVLLAQEFEQRLASIESVLGERLKERKLR